VIFGRRFRFAIAILASNVLLVSLAVAWLIQMLVIAKNGSIKFVENNPSILFIEIVLGALISLFGTIVFILQIRRLGEKRRGDEEDRRGRNQTSPEFKHTHQ
jgi:hypothetical protein